MSLYHKFVRQIFTPTESTRPQFSPLLFTSFHSFFLFFLSAQGDDKRKRFDYLLKQTSLFAHFMEAPQSPKKRGRKAASAVKSEEPVADE